MASSWNVEDGPPPAIGAEKSGTSTGSSREDRAMDAMMAMMAQQAADDDDEDVCEEEDEGDDDDDLNDLPGGIGQPKRATPQVFALGFCFRFQQFLTQPHPFCLSPQTSATSRSYWKPIGGSAMSKLRSAAELFERCTSNKRRKNSQHRNMFC